MQDDYAKMYMEDGKKKKEKEVEIALYAECMQNVKQLQAEVQLNWLPFAYTSANPQAKS